MAKKTDEQPVAFSEEASHAIREASDKLEKLEEQFEDANAEAKELKKMVEGQQRQLNSLIKEASHPGLFDSGEAA